MNPRGRGRPAKGPVGHVERSIAEGRRPFLTATVDPEAFRALDLLVQRKGLSRGSILDRLILAALDAEGLRMPQERVSDAGEGEATPVLEKAS